MSFELPPLGYASDALSPILSAETLGLHHGKHHKSYVTKLNGLIEGTAQAKADLETIVREAEGGLYNNAAQHFNHSMYWRCLAPGGAEPRGELKAAIERSFGSQEKLRDDFHALAAGVFGSGWAWLVKKPDGSLAIEGSSNAKIPLEDGLPILTIDVWEHAYYVDYRNERPRYLQEVWKLVNWDEVARGYASERLLVPGA